MPVATQASLKGITPEQLEESTCRLCLNNTYHLGLKPGQEVMDAVGGAHKLQGWKHNILTDSGGYVMSPVHPIDDTTDNFAAFKWLASSNWPPLPKKGSAS